MVKNHLAGLDSDLDAEHFRDLARLTEGFSGSDLRSLTREAAMIPVRECTGGKPYIATTLEVSDGAATVDTRTAGNSTDDIDPGSTSSSGGSSAKRKKPAEATACVRPVHITDFHAALKKIGASPARPPSWPLGVHCSARSV